MEHLELLVAFLKDIFQNPVKNYVTQAENQQKTT